MPKGSGLEKKNLAGSGKELVSLLKIPNSIPSSTIGNNPSLKHTFGIYISS